MNFKMQLPEGVRDYIGQEAYVKRQAEAQLREQFRLSGYEEMEPPAFEYAAVFESEVGNLRQENMVRFFDSDGRMLTLRPDFTLPCARIVSARAAQFSLPARVFYIGNAYGLEHNAGHQKREYTQAGAELMGAGGTRSDAEILMLAAQAMESLGLKEYVLDIGHVGFFFALLEQAGLSEVQAEQLRSLLDEKNAGEAKEYLEQLGVEEALAQQFLLLTDTYGSVEKVLRQAKEGFASAGCRKPFEELQAICSMLDSCGLKERVSLDLGLLMNMDYYTGVVFRGMAPGVGSPLLSGGRYDKVFEQFERPMPATGFAMGIERAMAALAAIHAWPCMPKAQIATGAEDGAMGFALAFAKKKRLEGIGVLTSDCQTQEELRRFAEEHGIMQIAFFNQSGQSIQEEQPWKR